jgi:ABC-type uncharacterized transport system permease subunit
LLMEVVSLLMSIVLSMLFPLCWKCYHDCKSTTSLAFCILCRSAAKFLLYKLSPNARADHSNHCRFEMFCRFVKSCHSHKVMIPTILVQEAYCMFLLKKTKLQKTNLHGTRCNIPRPFK